MAVSDAQLDYSYHIAFHQCFLTGDPAQDAFWHRQAQEMHLLSVLDAVRDVSWNAVTLSYRVPNQEAVTHLRYGLGRRSMAIWRALRSLYGIVQPSRENPLTCDRA